MNVHVKLLRNRDKPKDKNIFFGRKLVSRLVVIDSHQVPRAAKAWPEAVKNLIWRLAMSNLG